MSQARTESSPTHVRSRALQFILGRSRPWRSQDGGLGVRGGRQALRRLAEKVYIRNLFQLAYTFSTIPIPDTALV